MTCIGWLSAALLLVQSTRTAGVVIGKGSHLRGPVGLTTTSASMGANSTEIVETCCWMQQREALLPLFGGTCCYYRAF